jgi:hypothetical protein
MSVADTCLVNDPVMFAVIVQDISEKSAKEIAFEFIRDQGWGKIHRYTLWDCSVKDGDTVFTLDYSTPYSEKSKMEDVKRILAPYSAEYHIVTYPKH